MDNGYEWCLGAGTYEDLYYGTQVTIRDASGQKVALGELDEGALSDDSNICVFEFAVPGVPESAGVYSVAVSEDRGRHDFTLAQLEEDKTSLWFTLGDEPSVDDDWTTDDGVTQAEADCLNSRPDTWAAWDKCVGE